MAELCPACAAHEIDTPSGLCAPCVVERVAQAYAADRRQVTVRWIAWSQRTTQPDVEVVKLRQQRSRLRRVVQPHEPAPTDVDPWQIAAHALSELRKVRSTPQTREHLEAASECIRRLAWGPGD